MTKCKPQARGGKKSRSRPATRKVYPPVDAITTTIDNITIPDRLRALREDTIAELVESFGAIGLLHPITVMRPPNNKDSGYVLVAGWHRLEAAKRCRWEMIDCIVKHGLDADKAELAEIDENLIRAELSSAERAMHVARRKALHEKAHPETTAGKAPGKAGGGKKAKNAKLASFAEATAKATGQSKRKVARDATRGKSVVILPDVVGTSLDQGAELDALSKLPEAEQRKLAERAKAGEEVSAKPPKVKAAGEATLHRFRASKTSQTAETPAPAAETPAPSRDAGPYSPGECDRLRARVDELNAENCRLQIQIGGLESEVAELKERIIELEGDTAPAGAPNDDLSIPECLQRTS